MEKRHRLATIAAVISLPAGLASPAQAMSALVFAPSPIVLVAAASQVGCTSDALPGFGASQLQLTGTASTSKASAILGGQVSRLELIARQQAAPETVRLARNDAKELPGAGLIPGAGGFRCNALSSPDAQAGKLQPAFSSQPAVGDTFLGSKRLAIKRTSFDNSWNRVKSSSLSRRRLPSALQGESGQVTKSALTAVNSWTNAKVRYVEDQVLYGRADYWASANETLRRGAGDCEDIAIAKMQLLARMGVPRSDMFLTITRDLVRNADHAVLVVKAQGHFHMLDNSTDQVLDASESHDYRPIMSFNNSLKWLHGY